MIMIMVSSENSVLDMRSDNLPVGSKLVEVYDVRRWLEIAGLIQSFVLQLGRLPLHWPNRNYKLEL